MRGRGAGSSKSTSYSFSAMSSSGAGVSLRKNDKTLPCFEEPRLIFKGLLALGSRTRVGKDSQRKEKRGVLSRMAPIPAGTFLIALATEKGEIKRTETRRREHNAMVLPTPPWVEPGESGVRIY